ncbi:MAG: TetR/AcrR family transcriptional regulator [Actinomycetota bacterium]|nr:TetR/AcrR family transcriptional regulator [Actinomycetota bacterium]
MVTATPQRRPPERSARRMGRPRAIPNPDPGDPREEILAAAADLFAAVGYTATSTRMIAERVGLRQASLFHHFARKDLILAELLERTLRPTMQMVVALGAAALGPAATLWALVRTDVQTLRKNPSNQSALALLPETRDEQFAWFWKRRDRLFRFYQRQIFEGIDAGLFPRATRESSPDMVFGLVESVIHARPAVRRSLSTPPLMADAALRMLGADEGIIAGARALADG